MSMIFLPDLLYFYRMPFFLLKISGKQKKGRIFTNFVPSKFLCMRLKQHFQKRCLYFLIRVSECVHSALDIFYGKITGLKKQGFRFQPLNIIGAENGFSGFHIFNCRHQIPSSHMELKPTLIIACTILIDTKIYVMKVLNKAITAIFGIKIFVTCHKI